MYVRGHPVMAALAVAAGWAIAALWPLLTLPDEAGASGTLRSLGAASSVGMTVTALLLAVLVHRAWGAPALAGSGRTVAAVIVATALSAAAGDVVSHAWVTESLVGSLAEGLAVAVVVAAVYLVVLAFGDRSAMRAAVERGRRRRGRA
jgi:putative peptidoglycan lipid II flippase